MRKILFAMMVVAILACPTIAARYRQHQVTIVDEFGDAVTNIDIITIIDAGTSNNSTIYPTRAGGTMANPITTGSTASTFVQSLGLVSWFQAAPNYKITVTESGASQSLTIDNQSEGDTRFPFYVNYIGTAASLTVGDDNLLNIGTSADFTHDWDNANSRYVIAPASDGSGTLHFGKAAVHTDIYWHTGVAITSDYVLFSQGSANVQFIDVDLLLDDEAKFLIGDGSDVTIEYDENNNDLDILSTTALDEISFGADTDGYDVIWHGTTTVTNVLFDYSADEVLLTLADLKISQGSQIEFIDVSDGLTDWTIDNATDETLLIYPTETTDDQTVNLGNATNTTDLRIFGATASTVVYDASADICIHTDYNLNLTDADELRFGTGATAGAGDFIMKATNNAFTWTSILTDETPILTLGADTSGIDFQLFGATTAEGVVWDASVDSLTTTSDLALFTMTGVTLPFHVNVTGTVAGEAIKLETTNGGFTAQIDGVANGDVTINVGDEFLLDVTGGVAIDSAESAADAIGLVASDASGGITLNTGTAGITCSGDLLKNFRYVTENVTADDTLTTAESGTTYIVDNDTDGISLTLPAVGATNDGIWFTICDVNAVAASDVTVEPGTGDSISSGSADEGFSSDGADKIPCSATFIYHHANTTWYVLVQELDTGTAAWAPDGS